MQNNILLNDAAFGKVNSTGKTSDTRKKNLFPAQLSTQPQLVVRSSKLVQAISSPPPMPVYPKL